MRVGGTCSGGAEAHCGEVRDRPDQLVAEFERHFQFRPERQQKGVDTLITLDLVRLGQTRAYDTAVLIAGDRDIAEAVRTAQDLGRHVVVAHPQGAGMATELRQLADGVIPIVIGQLQRMLVRRPAST